MLIDSITVCLTYLIFVLVTVSQSIAQCIMGLEQVMLTHEKCINFIHVDIHVWLYKNSPYTISQNHEALTYQYITRHMHKAMLCFGAHFVHNILNIQFTGTSRSDVPSVSE